MIIATVLSIFLSFYGCFVLGYPLSEAAAWTQFASMIIGVIARFPKWALGMVTQDDDSPPIDLEPPMLALTANGGQEFGEGVVIYGYCRVLD